MPILSHNYVPSAKGATQSRPAPIILNPIPVNQHKKCTPLRPQVFAQLLNNHPDQAFMLEPIMSLQIVIGPTTSQPLLAILLYTINQEVNEKLAAL